MENNLGMSDGKLRAEIFSLVQYIRRFREEIAQMYVRHGEKNQFESMSDQLDAIVNATEDATHSILERAEKINALNETARTTDSDKTRNICLEKIEEETMAILEACTFQDITGQRVNKIVKSVKFVEERVNAMTALWGQSEVQSLANQMGEDEALPADDEALLNGPALPAESSISQSDIDKLFD